MTESATATASPYVGARPFEEDDRGNFFGREDEIFRLRSLAVSRRAVLLYSPSGAGKSSLLKAGLLPALDEKVAGAACLPVARVGGEVPPDLAVVNRYAFHLLSGLLGESAEPAEVARLSLRAGLQRAITRLVADRPAAEAPQVVFLTIDQFEEVFSSDPGRSEARDEFFRQLGEALRQEDALTLLLALREDWLAWLDPYLGHFPDRLRTRFRLELLGKEAARQAVTGPAAKAGLPFQPEAADLLVDDLLKSPVQELNGSSVERPGSCVDPVHLQIVCQRLWEESRAAETTEITASKIQVYGNVDRALAEYYTRRVREAAAVTKVPERAIREWCERVLITPQRIRGQVLQGEDQTAGLDNRVLNALVEAHLLRREPRRGLFWFELAHDRLIKPLLEDNAAWRKSQETDLERLAVRWEEEGRPERLLLLGRSLSEAEREAGAIDGGPPDTVQRFLRTSRSEAGSRTRTWIVILLLTLLLGSLGFNFFQMWIFTSWAGYGGLHRFRGELTGLAQRNIDRAVLLALAARELETHLNRIPPQIGPPQDEVPDSRQLLFESLAASPSLDFLEFPEPGPASAPPQDQRSAHSPDGRFHATGGADGILQLRKAGALYKMDGRVGPITALAFSPRGTRLAVGGSGGTIRLWDPVERRPEGEPLRGLEDGVLSLAFSPDGGELVSAHGRVTAHWRLTPGPFLGTVVDSLPPGLSKGVDPQILPWPEVPGITAAAIAYEQSLVATAAPDGIRLWDQENRRSAGGPFLYDQGGVKTLAFDAAGMNLFSLGNDGSVIRWNVDPATWERRACEMAGRKLDAKDVEDYLPRINPQLEKRLIQQLMPCSGGTSR
ncbi:MAG TPA: hypothetical protein DD490_16775 [Acidobacteria bacterium]|nr:hypothetical protein [Acidobacteriota bacterium]